jgi:hypothetical protein
MASKTELDGDKYLSAVKWAALENLAFLEKMLTEETDTGMTVTALNVLGPRPGKSGILLVVKAHDGQGGRWVGFQGGATVSEAVSALRKRWTEGSFELRADEPYTKP